MSQIIKEINKRSVPDLFLMPNGKVIKTKEEWEKIAKPYWKEVLLREEYGQVPPVINPTYSVETNRIDFAGKAVWQTVSFTFNHNDKSHTIPTQLIYPVGAKNAPFFLYLNFRPDIPDRYLPVEEIIDNGFGIFSVGYHDITRDDEDFTNGLSGLFQTKERKNDEYGKIMCWAYMASRMMDYLQIRDEVDKERVCIAGHSRLGKTALLAAALDERFKFVCSNDSGCSGAALSRGHCVGAETIKDILGMVPYWFCDNYQKYIDRDNELPFDQHCLISLIAPRRVHIGGALEDIWADNDNQFLSCASASKVWGLYDEKGLICPDRLPVEGDIFTDGELCFHLRKGKHFHSRTDWLIYMDAFKKWIRK